MTSARLHVSVCRSQRLLSVVFNATSHFSLHRIDRKMSCSQTNYKLDEAQAIFNELRSIKKAISTGEKERQDLIQVLPPSFGSGRPIFFADL